MTRYADRIDALARRAERDRQAFERGEVPATPAQALTYLREGVGPAVALYIDARTGNETVRFSHREFDRLERAMNDWLALYTACHGVRTEPEFTVREAAQLLIDTHHIGDVARLLTKVPAREPGAPARDARE
ncbi:hypothetical protein [Natronomonas sp. EA1]|uniref:hypothetical protein n=1 Tax=Natronomonas sp. EA1 TaxID=3421655 RepID=UPI003EBE1828